MIIRDLKRVRFKKPSFGYLLRYMFKNKQALTRNGQGGFVFRYNIKGSAVEEWESAFLENEQYRQYHRSNSVFVKHIILSYDPKDSEHLTKDKLLDLTTQFISTYHPHVMCVATVHYDTDHIHVHHCLSTIEYRSGKTIRHSKLQFEEVKKEVERYQIKEYPELRHSLAKHGKKERGKNKLSDREYRLKQRTGTLTKKEHLVSKLMNVFHSSTSLKAAKEKLRKQSITLYKRGGKTNGVLYEGLKYRLKTLGLQQEFEKVLTREKETAIKQKKQISNEWER